MRTDEVRVGVTVSQSYEGGDTGLAQIAEESGLDSVWVTDVIGSPKRVEAMTLATALLQATSRIAVGVAVLNTSLWYPQTLARVAGSLEALYPGRFILGAGMGSPGFFDLQRAWGYPVREGRDRSQFYRDTIAYLDAYFRERNLTFDSEFVRVTEATGSPFPAGRRPTLFMAGGGRSVMRLAARYADMWDGIAESTRENETYLERVQRKVTEFHAVCAEEGRDTRDVRIAPTLYTAVAATREGAEGIAANTRIIGDDRPPFVGTPEDLVEFLSTAVNMGARDFQLIVLSTRGSGPERLAESIRLIGNEVVPAVKHLG